MIIMHKLGGMLKRVNAPTESDVMNHTKNIEGQSVPATSRGGAFVIDVEVKGKKSI